MKLFLSILILFCAVENYSQRQTENWYFGDKAGLNFNNARRTVLNDSEMSTPKGSASISDKNGNLLFYTDGETVWNRNHQIMTNGTNLNGNRNGAQPVIIIPKPLSETEYFIVSTNSTIGLKYAKVEFNTANPNGIVVGNFGSLNNNTTERLTAVHHENGKDIWVISITIPNSSSNNTQIIAHKVDENGIDPNPIISDVGAISSSIGPLKISPDGKTIALATFNRFFYLFNFDKNTGNATLRFEANMDFTFGTGYHPRGVAFSNDSEVMYLSVVIGTDTSSTGFGILKVDLTQPIDPLRVPVFGAPIFFTDLYFAGDMQLALDGNIYCAAHLQNNNEINPFNRVVIITNANDKAINPNFRPLLLSLEDGNSMQGMPNFIQSYFASRILAENKCYVDTFNFTAVSYTNISNINWDFGDGNTANGLTINHTYAAPGNYTVKATLTINGSEISVFKNVTAFEIPVLQNNLFLEECDNDFDGKTIFNLNNIHPLISSKFAEESIAFFNSLNDASTSTNPITNSTNFENSNTNQQIWARVTNTNQCFDITSFTLRLNDNQLGAVNDFFTCETEDAKGDFDISTIINDAKNQLGLPNTINLKVYPSFADAQTNTNEVTGIFNTTSTQIFIKGFDANNACAGITNANLIVNILPKFDINSEYEICFNPSLKPPVTINLPTNFDTYEWENANEQILGNIANFTLTQTGFFTVTVTKLENGINCTKTQSFEVKNPPKPEFALIDVDTENENNNKIDVQINGNSSYQYSLDNQNFVGSGTSHLFENVTPGILTLYVKDVNDCEAPIQIDVAVIGFKNFFTPNGDGNNDFWTINGLNEQSFKSVNITIYNRFGAIVGVIRDFNTPFWDGTFNGKPQNENTYWFTAELIDINDKFIKRTGNFSLIRE